MKNKSVRRSRLKLAAVLVLAVSWLACDPASTERKSEPNVRKSIAIVVPVSIDAFERLQDGTKNVLKPLDMDLKVLSAEGDPSKFESVIKTSLLSHPDYLVTVGTQLTNTAFGPQFNGQLPITIAAAISDPKLVDGLVSVGLDPPRSQAVAIISDTPKEDNNALLAKTIQSFTGSNIKVGVLYNLSEINSKATAEGIIQALEQNNISVIRGVITGPDDVSKVTTNLLLRGAKAIVIPHDKYAVEKAATITQMARSKGIPTFSLDDGTVTKSGVMVAVSVDYRVIGEQIGQTIRDLSQGKTTAQSLPIVRLDRASVYLNETVAQQLGVTVPAEVRNSAVLIK